MAEMQHVFLKKGVQPAIKVKHFEKISFMHDHINTKTCTECISLSLKKYKDRFYAPWDLCLFVTQ